MNMNSYDMNAYRVKDIIGDSQRFALPFSEMMIRQDAVCQIHDLCLDILLIVYGVITGI